MCYTVASRRRLTSRSQAAQVSQEELIFALYRLCLAVISPTDFGHQTSQTVTVSSSPMRCHNFRLAYRVHELVDVPAIYSIIVLRGKFGFRFFADRITYTVNKWFKQSILSDKLLDCRDKANLKMYFLRSFAYCMDSTSISNEMPSVSCMKEMKRPT